MRNPLQKRLGRELISDLGKYLVIFVFLAGLISLVSGFLVADNSMIAAYNESFEKYQIEDGNFTLSQKADASMLEQLETDQNLHIYENFYIEETTKEVESTLRIFINRTEVDKVCLMDGSFPETTSEIAIDRMYADNNDLTVGDTLTVGGKEMHISGLVALSDYSALFSDPSDMMFDSIKFGVAIVTEETFDAFGDAHFHASYAWKYDTAPKDDEQASQWGNDLLTALSGEVASAAAANPQEIPMQLEGFLPAYNNQAIHFTGDDMGGDRIMFIVFLYIVVVILAFIFAVTTSNTITKEASVIGTLRASGYTKGELVRHYMTMPVLVTLLAACVGNVLGYTVFKSFFANMYYGSYSLPTYETRWNANAFLQTTVIPIVLMLLVNLVMLNHKLTLTPLQFLRHQLSRKQKKKAFRLSTKIKFFTRFRIRVVLQNMPNFVTLFVGIFFANFILQFGFLFNPLLDHYKDEICGNMTCSYQYILKAPVETEQADAEAYCATSLESGEKSIKEESISIYGIAPDSAYLSLPEGWKGAYVTDDVAAKYRLKEGDTLTLHNAYDKDETHDFTVSGTYNSPGTMAIYLPIDDFREEFNQDAAYFNGYFSNEELTDLDEHMVASVITEDDLTKVSRQLENSMGDMMSLFIGFGVVMFLLLMYLLIKLIIEKNAQSISMVKVLGYSNGEVGRLYLVATTIVVLASLLLSLPLCDWCMRLIWNIYIAKEMSGWISYYVEPFMYVKMFLLGVAAYAVVAALQLLKIKRIPMTDALKNVE